MDNRQFNVNGSGLEMLKQVLNLAFIQADHRQVAGYYIDPKKGLILLWHNLAEYPIVALPPIPGEEVANLVWSWLESSPDTECEEWDEDCDHDGHNELGWRVYIETWGHIEMTNKQHNEVGRYATIAIKPAYLWHGK